MQDANTKVLTTRVSVQMAAEAKKAADRKRDPYAPTVSMLLARGLELALRELKDKRPSK